MTDSDNIYKTRSDFVGSANKLLLQSDIFGNNPVMVRLSSKDYSLSTTDQEKKLVKTAFFEPSPAGFIFMEAECIYHPYDNGILKEGVFHSI